MPQSTGRLGGLAVLAACLFFTNNQTLAFGHSQDDINDSTPPLADPNPAPCISWVNPQVKPRVALLCIHGLGLYSGSYKNFALRLSRSGIITYAIDVRGFGSWMKAEGKSEVDFKDCLGDIRAALISIRMANPGLPVFILGESMGGAIALRATALYPELIDGLISSVPAGERFRQRKTELKVAFDFLKGPNKQRDVGPSVVDQATTDPRLRQDWIDNPLDRMDLSPKELWQFQKFMNENHDYAKQIQVTPVLFVQGNKDKLVKPEGTWELFNEQGTEQKTFLAVPSEHLIFEEQQDQSQSFDERIDQLVSAWIAAHGQMGAAPQPVAKDNSNDAAPPAPPQRLQNIDPVPSVSRGQATVLAFYANWCEQCKSLDSIFTRARNQSKKPIKFAKIDIDDPKNADLVKHYDVGPIPTFVYLKPSGKAVSMSVGEINYANFATNVTSNLQ